MTDDEDDGGGRKQDGSISTERTLHPDGTAPNARPHPEDRTAAPARDRRAAVRRGTIRGVIQAEPINARFVGGPLDGETHRLAHRLPYVQVPGPDESFFARLWIERPDCADHLLYAVDGADDAETLVYRTMADRPAGDPGPVAGVIDPATAGAPSAPDGPARNATADAASSPDPGPGDPA